MHGNTVQNALLLDAAYVTSDFAFNGKANI